MESLRKKTDPLLLTTQRTAERPVRGLAFARTTRPGGVRSTRGQQTVSVTGINRNRSVPLVLLGVTDKAALEPLATMLDGEGVGLAVAHGDRACLRVASAVQPDVILLDPRLPRALLSLLRGHPLLRAAQISWSQALGGPIGSMKNRS